MAKKRATHKRRQKFTLSIGIVAGLMPGLSNAFSALNHYGFNGMGVQVSRDFLGYDPQSKRWLPSLMMGGLGPLAIGMIVHKAASILGVNRMLARVIPILRI